MNLKDLLLENQRQIDKANYKISINEDLDYWTQELDTLMNEREMIKVEQWQ